jgi:uncharacterized protein (DUF433 family)
MSTADSRTNYAHITFPPNGSEPCIDGLRLRVRDIVAARHDGLTPEQIISDCYPFLSLGQVYSALAYYEDHREEIEGYHSQETGFVEEFKRQHPDMVIDRRNIDE